MNIVQIVLFYRFELKRLMFDPFWLVKVGDDWYHMGTKCRPQKVAFASAPAASPLVTNHHLNAFNIFDDKIQGHNMSSHAPTW